MFVFLSKLIPPFIYPVGLACILILVAIFLYRRTRWQRFALIAALLVLWLAGSRWVAMGLSRSLEWQYLPQEIPKADVIVLLGGGTTPGEYPEPGAGLNGAGARVLFAAKLFKEGKAPAILVTGGNVWMSQEVSNPARDMQEVLGIMGVPKEAVWLEEQSQNTYENALFTAKILKEKGINKAILVTSASHMPRSVGVFKKQGIEVMPAPVDFNVTQKGWEELMQFDLLGQALNLMPNESNMTQTTSILKEYIGMFVYRMRGWSE